MSLSKSVPVEPEYVERTIMVCKNCCQYPCYCERRRLDELAPTAPAAGGETLADVIGRLDFEDTSPENIADRANIGQALLMALAENVPSYSPLMSPAEIVCDLLNERDEAREELRAAQTKVAELESSLSERIEECARWESLCVPVQKENLQLRESIADLEDTLIDYGVATLESQGRWP